MGHRCRRCSRGKRRHLGIRSVVATVSDWQPTGVCVPLRPRRGSNHLFHNFPLMLLLILFSPLIGAALIPLGAPPRRTALSVAIVALLLAVAAFVGFSRMDSGSGDFQFVNSFN